MPAVRPLEAGDHAQAGGLARARRAQHREELAAPDLEVDPVDRDDVAVGLADAAEANVDVFFGSVLIAGGLERGLHHVGV